eukprot:SAG31_NODE_44872_length_261_cov_0.629630_1_plen_44_part_10
MTTKFNSRSTTEQLLDQEVERIKTSAAVDQHKVALPRHGAGQDK